MVGDSNPSRGKRLCFLQTIQTHCGAQQLGREVDHSPPHDAEVKKERSYSSAPPICLYHFVPFLY